MFLTEQNLAWQYDWGKLCECDEVLWANPPLEDVKKDLTKACLERYKMILVVPEWKSKETGKAFCRNWLWTNMFGPDFVPFSSAPMVEAF